MTSRSRPFGSLPANSSSAGHLDATSDDLLLQLLDARAGAVRNERFVAIVVDVADAALLQAKGIDPALEGVVLHSTNHVERRGVDTLHHRRQNVSRRFVVLVGIGTDRELVRRARRLEYALT